ncbi:hypothetical protein PUN28_012323 [Cardiocondyla obscurior]|uniref:Uncharacterized protein n=1 Tax=Cardiocondyla obscurior TaxID=286306 RepID=A0AAW2FD84_9HYME
MYPATGVEKVYTHLLPNVLCHFSNDRRLRADILRSIRPTNNYCISVYSIKKKKKKKSRAHRCVKSRTPGTCTCLTSHQLSTVRVTVAFSWLHVDKRGTRVARYRAAPGEHKLVEITARRVRAEPHRSLPPFTARGSLGQQVARALPRSAALNSQPVEVESSSRKLQAEIISIRRRVREASWRK